MFFYNFYCNRFYCSHFSGILYLQFFIIFTITILSQPFCFRITTAISTQHVFPQFVSDLFSWQCFSAVFFLKPIFCRTFSAAILMQPFYCDHFSAAIFSHSLSKIIPVDHFVAAFSAVILAARLFSEAISPLAAI